MKVKAKSTHRNNKGNMMMLCVAMTIGLVAAGVFFANAGLLFRDQRKTSNAVDAGTLALGKEVLLYPFYDLEDNPLGLAHAKDFESQAFVFRGRKVINLETINALWAQTYLSSLNLIAMAQETGVNADALGTAQNNLLGLYNDVEAISDYLADKMENDPAVKRRYEKVFKAFLSQNKGAKTGTNGEAHQISFVNRGEKSNVKIDLNSIPTGIQDPDLVAQIRDVLKDGSVPGYSDATALKLPSGKLLRFRFIPIAMQPHLISNSTFEKNQPKQSVGLTDWKKPLGNSLSLVGVSKKGAALQALASVIAGSVRPPRAASLAGGFIELENEEGLNLDTAESMSKVGTNKGSARGVFSAADYANAQLLVQRSNVDPVGGAHKQFRSEDLRFSEEQYTDFVEKIDLLERIFLDRGGLRLKHPEQWTSNQKFDIGLIMSSSRNMEQNIDRILKDETVTPDNPGLKTLLEEPRVIGTLLSLRPALSLFEGGLDARKFGTLPDFGRYPHFAKLAALRPNEQSVDFFARQTYDRSAKNQRLLVAESGLSEYGNVNKLVIRSAQIRDNRMYAGMNVLPEFREARTFGEAAGKGTPERILSAAFRPGFAQDALKVGRDGTPYELLGGDNLSTSDIESVELSPGKKTTLPTRVTPTCTLVRFKLLERIHEIDPSFPNRQFEDVHHIHNPKFKNLLHYGYAVENIADIPNAQPKLLKFGQKAYIYMDKVMVRGTETKMLVMKLFGELTAAQTVAMTTVQPDGPKMCYQGRIFDGTNHQLQGRLINVDGDYGYTRPYYRVTDVNARDRFNWTPSTGANGMLGRLKFQTVICRGDTTERAGMKRPPNAMEEISQAANAINFFQVSADNTKEVPEEYFCDAWLNADGKLSGNAEFFDPYNEEPDPSSMLPTPRPLWTSTYNVNFQPHPDARN